MVFFYELYNVSSFVYRKQLFDVKNILFHALRRVATTSLSVFTFIRGY